MGKKTELIGKSDDEAGIAKAWSDAKAWLSGVGQSTTSTPDTAKIAKAMARAKKGMAFVAVFENGKDLEIVATVGGAVVETLTWIDFSAGGNQKGWREALVRLKQNSKLFGDAELKAWDAKHPDPEKAGEIKDRMHRVGKEIAVLTYRIKEMQAQLKAKGEELLGLQKTVKAIGG